MKTIGTILIFTSFNYFLFKKGEKAFANCSSASRLKYQNSFVPVICSLTNIRNLFSISNHSNYQYHYLQNMILKKKSKIFKYYNTNYQYSKSSFSQKNFT